jgi:hypothetical protein
MVTYANGFIHPCIPTRAAKPPAGRLWNAGSEFVDGLPDRRFRIRCLDVAKQRGTICERSKSTGRPLSTMDVADMTNLFASVSDGSDHQLRSPSVCLFR